MFCNEEKELLLNDEVVDQILLLTFSLALRLKFSAIFASYRNAGLDFLYHSNDDGSEYWQIQTLLSAYKQLSDAKGITKLGIFPFELSKISDDKTFAFWMVEFRDQQKKAIADFEQYTENFTFIVKISKFSLPRDDVIKIINAIIDNEVKDNGKEDETKLPEVYTFVKNYFVGKMKSGEEPLEKFISCVLYNFGFKLISLLLETAKETMGETTKETTKKFSELFEKHKTGHENKHAPIVEVVEYEELYKVFGLGYSIVQIELEMFNEPIGQYERAIGFKETERTESPTGKPTKGKGKQKTDGQKDHQKMKGKKANKKRGQ
ncbi:hypothetical protein niasHT_008263 [Heterodera trifolii]|uniref:Uncharacterized protein n=1 Tax=Heterodera trifolii TaxID=157864 RepID=A0ABD2M1D9_9BILA